MKGSEGGKRKLQGQEKIGESVMSPSSHKEKTEGILRRYRIQPKREHSSEQPDSTPHTEGETNPGHGKKV